jgi:hypothetical protein
VIAVGVIVPGALVIAMQSASEFSRSMERHVMGAPHSAQDLAIVVAGAVVVLVTTAYAVIYLARPGETDPHHVKRRILDDDRRESR